MKANYSLREISELLEAVGFNVKAELSPDEMTANYFTDYNNANPEHALFSDGQYVTNEQMNDKKFLKLVNG